MLENFYGLRNFLRHVAHGPQPFDLAVRQELSACGHAMKTVFFAPFAFSAVKSP
jgi:hypothetical protein